MRIVPSPTPNKCHGADKFRAAVLVVAAGFHNDFAGIVQAAGRAKTRVVVLADTGESAQRHMSNGANGVVYRNVTSAALVDCVRKVARGENWVAGCRRAQRTHRKRYGRIARPRPLDGERASYRCADCTGLQK